MRVRYDYEELWQNPRDRYYMEKKYPRRGSDRRRNAGRRPGEDRYVDISKAIPVWALGTGITLAGMLTGYVTAQDNKLEAAIKENAEANHKQDLAVRELQILMDQMIQQQKATNQKLDKLVDSVDRVTQQLSNRPQR